MTGAVREAPSLLHVLAAHARADAARPACVFRDAAGAERTIGRGALWQGAQAFAARLRRLGAPPGAPFLIALPSRPEMLTAFFGAMLAGLVPAFMPYATAKQNASLFWGAHRELFARIGCRHFLTFAGNAILAEAAPDGATVLLVEDIADWFDARGGGAAPPDPETPAATADATALLQHTSGTTGLKKGVMLSHGAILRQVSAYAEAIGFGADDIVVSWLPLYHDMGLIACLLMPLLVGARLVLLDAFEWVAKPTTLLDAAERHRASFCWLPNFAFLHLCRAAPPEQRWDLASLRAVIDCSEPCKVATLERFHERFEGCGLRRSALRTCYAMAENVFAVTQTAGHPRGLVVDRNALEIDGRVTAPTDGRGLALCSCGPPIAGAAIEIRDAARRPLGERTVGEIAIRTPCLFEGYNAMPEATAAALADGWYATGDLGFLDEGELFVTGRKDDLIIVYGRNYYAHAVEEAASTCDGVVPGRAVAFALDNEATGSRDAVLLVEGDGSREEREMRRTVKARVFDATGLTLHSVKVLARGTLVKSTAGKISRAENRRLYVSEGSTA